MSIQLIVWFLNSKNNVCHRNGDVVLLDKTKLPQVNGTSKYQEHFEVFIQTLISQALDPNFITEIVRDNGE